MTDIDLDALQATNGIQIPLIDGAVRVRSVAVTGASKQGFAAISAVALRVSVPMLRGEGGPSVTVTVQKSSNGSAWSTAHAFTFTTSGDAEFVLEDPLDYLRVVCAPGGGLREAVVASVVAVPQFVDPPAGAASLPSGGTTGQVLTKASDTDGDADWEDANGGSQPDEHILSKAILVFTETEGAGTYTAELDLSAGAHILDVVAYCIAGPWTATADAMLNAGDTANADGYIADDKGDLVNTLVDSYTGTSLTNTSGSQWADGGPTNEGGQEGPYLTAFLQQAAVSYAPGMLYPTGDTITATVVTTGAVTVGGVATASVGASGGTDYAPGDTGLIDAGNGDATYEVDTVDGGGAVLTFTVTTPGTGYSTGTDNGSVPTSGGGSGFLVNVDSIVAPASGRVELHVMGFGIPPQTITANKT